MVSRIVSRAHCLKATGAVNVGDRRKHCTLLLADRIHLLHERIGHRVNEVLVQRLLQNRGRKWSELLAKLYLGVDQLAHVRAPRVGEDAPIAERSGTPLHASLEPAD